MICEGVEWEEVEEERSESGTNEWPGRPATPRPNDLSVLRGIAPHDVELQYEV